LPSPAAALQVLYGFHEQEKIEAAKQRRLPQQIAFIPDETLPCEAQAAFVACAFKADERTGAQMLEEALAARTGTSCYRIVLGWVARRRYTSEVEQAAATHLDDPDPEVAANAAGTLGGYGSPAA
jgi:hypothetical protein